MAVGSYKSAVGCVVKLMRLNAATGETWDNRDLELREQKGSVIQKHGAAWADALHVHSGRTAYWSYMHKAKHHLKKGVVDNGCPANGDDMVFETKHRQNKRLGPLVWQGGKAASEHSVVQQQRPKQICVKAPTRKRSRTETYDSRAWPKINNEAAATQVGHMQKTAEHFEALEPAKKKSKRVVRVEGIKTEEVPAGEPGRIARCPRGRARAPN